MTNAKRFEESVSPWAVLVFFVAVIATHIALLFYFGIDNDESLVVNDIFLPFESLCAVLAVWHGARYASRSDKELARAWYVITFGVLSWFLGEAAWTFIQLVLGRDPYPSVADVFYLLYYPLLAAGVILIPRTPLKDVNRSEYLAYAGLFIVPVVLAFCYFLLYPLLTAEREGWAIFVFSALYPVFDLLVLVTTLALFLLMLRKQPNAPIWCVLISVVAMTVTDSIFGLQEINDLYTGGSLLDVGWSLSLMFIALAGAFQARAAERVQ